MIKSHRDEMARHLPHSPFLLPPSGRHSAITHVGSKRRDRIQIQLGREQAGVPRLRTGHGSKRSDDDDWHKKHAWFQKDSPTSHSLALSHHMRRTPDPCGPTPMSDLVEGKPHRALALTTSWSRDCDNPSAFHSSSSPMRYQYID